MLQLYDPMFLRQQQRRRELEPWPVSVEVRPLASLLVQVCIDIHVHTSAV